jgi:TonB-linked SusC/RagA family outer membrane protein
VQQKKTVTGAVATVGDKELLAVPSGDAAALLQGRLAGITVTSNNSPGGEASVRIRGVGSINNNNPLYIIDGVPTTTGLTHINPNDIESMTALKDASSSAIYGSRAANGVIVVTTKRGKSGAPKLSFDARYGVQQAVNQLNLLNTQELGELLWLENRNRGLSPGDPGWGDLQYGYGPNPVIPDYVLPAGKMAGEVDESTYSYPNPYNGITRANKEGTNWYNEIFINAPIQEYNLALSGGGENNNYAISAGYMDQNGIVDQTGFKRYTLRANSDVKLKKWLEVGQSLGFAYTDRVSFGNNDEYNPVSMSHRMHPILPVYDIRGNYAGSKVLSTGNAMNPKALLERNKDDFSRQMRLLGNFYTQVNLMEGLSIRSLFGIDYTSNRTKDIFLMDPEYTQTNYTNRLNENYSGGLQYNWSNTLNYSKKIGNDHKLNILLGTEALKNNYEFLGAGRSTFAFSDFDYMVINAGEKDITNSGTFDEWSLFSYFARANYSYQEKYLFEAVTRRDASSRFSKANRWGTFPAFSAGWRISSEAFMAETTWINDLKIRAGWGMNGNDNVGNYNSYTTYRNAGNASYYNIAGTSSTQTAAGFHKYALGNPNGRWEATTTTNLGIDLVLFDFRFEANVDVYTRNTTNMLYPEAKPDTWGGLVLPSINIGEMNNKGIDVILNYRGKPSRTFNYNVSANLSHYKNQIVSLNNNPNEIRFGNSLREEVYTASKAGLPISSFFGYQVEGIFNTQEEVNAHPKYNPDINGVDSYSKPGMLKYKDVNGDGKITPDDRTFIGNPHPNFTYGFNINMSYNNWDMSMFLQGSQGNDLINYLNRWTLFNLFEGNRKKERLYESWTPERYQNGDKITVPMAIRNDAAMQKPSSFFVENGSYFRLKNIQIGYSLSPEMLSRLKIDRLRIYAQATNLFTITKYSGLDPEVSIANDRHMGVDEGIYPVSRMYLLGVNLNL